MHRNDAACESVPLLRQTSLNKPLFFGTALHPATEAL